MEPRVDSLVGFALPQIIKYDRGIEVETVIPELPLRIGSVQTEHEGKIFANKSYKVDFFVKTSIGNNILIEFKTDSGSRRAKQDEYLECARLEGMKAVILGILLLYKATTYKDKYKHLLKKLESARLIERTGEEFKPSVANEKVDILYIQPHSKEGDEELDILDFKTITLALEEYFRKDEFMLSVAEAFRLWAGD